jgi:hypothetical protein
MDFDILLVYIVVCFLCCVLRFCSDVVGFSTLNVDESR